MDDLLRESEKHKRQMSHNQKVILGSMTEIGTLGENTERSPGHIITNSPLLNLLKLYLGLWRKIKHCVEIEDLFNRTHNIMTT